MAETISEPTRRRRPIDDLLDAEAGQMKPPVPDEQVPGSDAPSDPAAVIIPRGWGDIESAPQDGKRIMAISADGMISRAVWRNTRMFDNCGGRTGGIWRVVGFWAVPDTGGNRLSFEPVAWRPE